MVRSQKLMGTVAASHHHVCAGQEYNALGSLDANQAQPLLLRLPQGLLSLVAATLLEDEAMVQGLHSGVECGGRGFQRGGLRRWGVWGTGVHLQNQGFAASAMRY